MVDGQVGLSLEVVQNHVVLEVRSILDLVLSLRLPMVENLAVEVHLNI